MTLNLQQLNRIAINYKLTVHNNEEKYKAYIRHVLLTGNVIMLNIQVGEKLYL